MQLVNGRAGILPQGCNESAASSFDVWPLTSYEAPPSTFPFASHLSKSIIRIRSHKLLGTIRVTLFLPLNHKISKAHTPPFSQAALSQLVCLPCSTKKKKKQNKQTKKNHSYVCNKLFYTLFFYTFLVMYDVISLDVWIDFGCRIDFSLCRQGNHKTEAMQNGKGGGTGHTHDHFILQWPTFYMSLSHIPLPCHE